MSDVFLSYARENKDFAQRLCRALMSRDKDVWVDWQDIPPTADWLAEVERGIESADTFLFFPVLTPDSLESEVCSHEIHFATRLNKRIVPVVHEDATGARYPRRSHGRTGSRSGARRTSSTASARCSRPWTPTSSGCELTPGSSSRPAAGKPAAATAARSCEGSELDAAEAWLGNETEESYLSLMQVRNGPSSWPAGRTLRVDSVPWSPA